MSQAVAVSRPRLEFLRDVSAVFTLTATHPPIRPAASFPGLRDDSGAFKVDDSTLLWDTAAELRVFKTPKELAVRVRWVGVRPS